METAPTGNPSMISIGLMSGACIYLNAVFLYPSDKILQARVLQAQAAKNLGGISTGIGFWGSPEWAIGGGIALGLLEGIASSAAAKEGLKQMEKAGQILGLARKEGQFIPINRISNADLPFPENWACPATKEQETGLLLFGPKTETVNCPWIHNGSPFIYAQSADQDPVFIALDKIQTYQPIWLKPT